jgi:hypothetical protein
MRGSYGDMPPGMKQWARGVDSAISALQQETTSLRTAIRQLPTYQRVASTISTALVSPAGNSGGWQQMPPESGPDVPITTRSGLVIITMSCAFDLIDASTASSRQAVAAMCATLGESTAGMASADLQALSRQGLMRHWTPAAGQNSDRLFAASRTIYRNVEPGDYKVIAAYPYNLLSAGVNINWLDRQIIVETI